MPLRYIILFSVTGLYFWGCHYLVTCKWKMVCYDCAPDPSLVEEFEAEPPAVDPALLAATHVPLLFQKDYADPVLNENFNYFLESVSGRMKPGQSLEITGWYYSGERNLSEYDNLGLARAYEIQQLFAEMIPENRFSLRSKMIDGQPNKLSPLFEAAEFFWVKSDELLPAQTDGELVVMEEETIVQYPLNAVEHPWSAAVDDYLEDLSMRLQTSDEKVMITGHTDSQGSVEFNRRLGLERAQTIAELLMQKGVQADQIITVTKGESEPLFPNDSEEGRQRNRRIVIKIMPN